MQPGSKFANAAAGLCHASVAVQAEGYCGSSAVGRWCVAVQGGRGSFVFGLIPFLNRSSRMADPAGAQLDQLTFLLAKSHAAVPSKRSDAPLALLGVQTSGKSRDRAQRNAAYRLQKLQRNATHVQ